ncbi:C3 and PZP-like alpha-2-macroglobulin domain-containing protein 8 isoform X2 [Apostichopus japonicus]
MVQWEELHQQCCGLRNATFPLSDQPILGEWKIFAEVRGQTYNKTFKVEKYVAPKFEVLIHTPRYIVDINRCKQASVEARYTFGKPVTGKVSINMNLVGIGYYDNYIGNNVYLFGEIDGVAHFNICVSQMVSSPLNPYFKGAIEIEATVTSSDGHVFVAKDDSCLVKRQPIAVEYTPDTVKYFKPGLPFEGKLSVFFPDGSEANQVTVRVNAESDYNIFHEEDLISENGIISFKVDRIPKDATLVWFSAKVTKWKGRYPGGTYNSVYHSASSWYSPSNCYIQSKLLNNKLKVGDRAVVGILSSCSCNVTFHYHLMSRGDIVFSGVKEPNPNDISMVAVNDTILCKTAITFGATHAMAPATQLVVYYLKEDNETVADHLPLQVEPSFENEVGVQFSSNHTSPGSKLTMTITAKQGSCICVGSVDRSVQLLQPGYELNSAKIFSEMNNYNSLEPPRPETWWTTRNKRNTNWRGSLPTDSYEAFKATGLHVMTDRANLRFQPVITNPDERPSIYQSLKTRQDGERVSRNVRRAYFPETWLWDCYNMSSTRKHEQFRVHLPDSITTWSTQAFALSEVHGFGLSQMSPLVSIKRFFVDFTLPYSVIRGEQVRLPVSVYNYQDICVQVTLTVVLQEGARFWESGDQTRTETLCMQEHETQTVNLEVEFNQLGKVRMLAAGDAHTAFGCCSDDIGDAIIASDKISRALMVEPEGIPRAYTYSVFFCPNERIHLSTPNRYEYQFLKKPPGMDFLVFMCKASNDARIALAPSVDSHLRYEIVIGGWENTQTWLSRDRNGPRIRATVTRNVLNRNEFRAFWIIWKKGHIQVGYGEVPSNQSMILRWQDDAPLLINHIGFSTGFGSTGEFRIWKKESNSEMFIEAFTLTLPLNYIPGSEKAKAVMLADVMGPTLTNLQKLIRLPFGCGEQNMIHFAPNIYVMSYLERTGQLTPEIKSEATGFLVQGYQRQLTYKRHDGSYSAFGENDSSGSMWLTAFVVKSFAQSEAYIYIDPLELAMTKSWIISSQLLDGSFPPVGRVLNKDIQGGVQGMVSLTAYVVVALLESGLVSDRERLSVERGQRFLEGHIAAIHDSYTAALTAYALTLRESHRAPEVMEKLQSQGHFTDGLRYWTLNGEPHEILPHYKVLGNLQQTVASAEVEMTAYALLTFAAKRDIAYSLPIVKWLTKQRNSLGGFSSTQDTCVALQALSEYAALSFVRDVNLTISLGYVDQGRSVEQIYHINNDNSKVLQIVEVPALSQNLFLRSTGEGCGLLQVDVNYNIPDPNRNPPFKLNVDIVQSVSEQLRRGKRNTNTIPGTRRNKARISIKVCTRWQHIGSSNMAVIEVDLISGFTADIQSLEELLIGRHVKRYEVEGRKVILYFDEIPSQCMTCVTFIAQQDFLVRKLQAVPVKVYDYYEPHYEAIRLYNVTGEIRNEVPCKGEHCNEVGDGTIPEELLTPYLTPRELHLCNTVNGDCVFMADSIQCSCERTCSYGGPRVCGNDGIIYDNYCHLEVAACQQDEIIRIIPMTNCREAAGEQMSVEQDDDGGPSQLQEDETPDEEEDNDYQDESDSISSAFSQSPFIPIIQWFSQNTVPPGFLRSESLEPVTPTPETSMPHWEDGETMDDEVWQMEPLSQLPREDQGYLLNKLPTSSPFSELWMKSFTPSTPVMTQQDVINETSLESQENDLDEEEWLLPDYEEEEEEENEEEEEDKLVSNKRNDTSTEKPWVKSEVTNKSTPDMKLNSDRDVSTERMVEADEGEVTTIVYDDDDRYGSTTMNQERDNSSQEEASDDISRSTMKAKSETELSDMGWNVVTEEVPNRVTNKLKPVTERVTTESFLDEFVSSTLQTRMIEDKSEEEEEEEAAVSQELEQGGDRDQSQVPRWLFDHKVPLPDILSHGTILPWNQRVPQHDEDKR